MYIYRFSGLSVYALLETLLSGTMSIQNNSVNSKIQEVILCDSDKGCIGLTRGNYWINTYKQIYLITCMQAIQYINDNVVEN